MTYGKTQSIVSVEKFLKKSLKMHARTWLSLYESIIYKIIEKLAYINLIDQNFY